jgi:hypothetical protein
MYTIRLNTKEELPVSFKTVIDAIAAVGKLFKTNTFKYALLYEDGKLLKKLVNPRFKEVSKEVFFSGFYEEGFILKDDTTQYYINN